MFAKYVYCISLKFYNQNPPAKNVCTFLGSYTNSEVDTCGYVFKNFKWLFKVLSSAFINYNYGKI